MAAVLLVLAAWLLIGEPVNTHGFKGHLIHRELTDRYPLVVARASLFGIRHSLARRSAWHSCHAEI